MATTAAPGTDRAHKAAKRYIYAWGEGTAEGNGKMKDLLGGKGAGLAEMTIAGLPTPPGFTITTEACNDYFAAGKALPAGLWDDVLEAMHEVERRSGKGFGDASQPAAGLRPLGRQVLDARDDGHGPQPRPQRADAARPDRAHGQRALRLGRVPAVHPDVRPDRHGRERRPVRRPARGAQGAPRPRRRRHGPHRRRPQGARRGVQGDRQGRHRPRLPDRPVRAARPRDQGRVRVLVRQARQRLPQQPAHRPRPRHRGQRRDDGVRQHGRRLRHRRRVHPRPQHRREGPLRRVPDQRPGRGRRRRHPDRAQDRADGRGHADGLRGVRAHRPAARGALPQRPGPRVHDRARAPVHAPDPRREADRGGRREDRRRHGRRGDDQQGGGRRPHRAGPGGPAPARHLRPRRAQGREEDRQRPQRLARRRRRSGRVRRRHAPSSGSSAARRSSSSGSRPRPTTSTAWP